MSTYAQLKSELEALQARANEALAAEKATAIRDMLAKIAQFDITAVDLGLEGKKVGRPPKAAAGQAEAAAPVQPVIESAATRVKAAEPAAALRQAA